MLKKCLRGHHILHMESQNVVKCSLWLSRNIGIIPGSILFLRNPIVHYFLRVVFPDYMLQVFLTHGGRA